MNLPLINLYDTDFYAWTQKQVQLLRKNELSQLDVENLIEEIDCLGKQQQQELVNRLGVLLGHLLKWEYQPSRRSRSWVTTIREQRRRITKLLQKNPSLKSFLDEAIAEAYPSAVDLAIDETGIDISNFPSEIPYAWDQMQDPSFFPGDVTDLGRDLLMVYGISGGDFG